MSNVHYYLERAIEKHRHKFPGIMFRGVSITEFNAEELRAVVCIIGELRDRDMRERARDTSILNSLKTGRQHD